MDQRARCKGLQGEVSNNYVLGLWAIVIIVQVLGKYMIVKSLDPWGKGHTYHVQASC